MTSFLMILIIVGPLVLYGLVKTGVHLIIPLLICVVAAGLGIIMFMLSMNAAPHEGPLAGGLSPTAVYGMLIVASAAFGGILLGVVVLARWFGGEYKDVKQGHET